MSDAAISDRPTFSVVIPCRNEEANVDAIAAAVIREMEQQDGTFDLLFIDNASEDATVQRVREMCARDPRIRLIVNTRNFGQMRSPTHAVLQTRGRAVIGLCADFQDPPELIGRLIAHWRAGADIVLGVRESEQSSLLFGWWRNLSYAFAARFSDYPIIPHATGFGLYDRRVIDAIAALNEPEPFFRGMLVETGFTVETVRYARPRRAAGRSNNDFFALIDFSLSALSGSSKRVIRLPFYVGIFAGLASIVTMLLVLHAAIAGGDTRAWLAATAIEAQFALIFIFLGLIGDQVRLVSERTRATPLVIERERVNFPADR